MRLLIFSDIHSDLKALERLMATEADFYFAAGDMVNWGRNLAAVGEILKRRGDRVYVIPGNHESPEQIEQLCGQFGLRNFHERTMQIGEYHVAGFGCSNITPFETPGEYTEEQIEEKLKQFAGLKPLVAIFHCPPFGTMLDRITNLRHAGSRAVRGFIEKEQPRYFFCGHIHEAGGMEDRMGETRGLNVGKKGYLLELETKQ